MKSCLVAAVVALAITQPAFAEEIQVTAEQITKLGIELSPVMPANRTFAVAATARVVIPPAGQFAVSTAQAGSIVSLHAAVGDPVVAGQLLAEIRSPDFVTIQREFMDAKGNSSFMSTQLQRDLQLFDEGIIAHRRLQETEIQARLAAARLNEYRQLLELGGVTESQIDSLEAEYKLLEFASVVAPFDGVVLDVMAMTGERLEALQPIYRIADLSNLWLDIQVAGESADLVKPGMQVTAEVMREGMVQAPKATVLSVGQARNDRSQTVSVRAEVQPVPDTSQSSTHPGSYPILQPGQFVSVKIISDGQGRADLWSFPASAVIHKGPEAFVFVRSTNGFMPKSVALLSVEDATAFVEVELDATAQVAVVGVVALKALWSGEIESEGNGPSASGTAQ